MTQAGSDEALRRISPVAGCGRQAEESEGLPQSPQPSAACTHTVETHWRGTAMSSFGLMLEIMMVRALIYVTNPIYFHFI